MIVCKNNTYYHKDYYKDKQKLPEHLIWTIEGFLQKYKARSVLEVGCGTGYLLNFLNAKGHSVYGCDISFYAVKETGQVNANAKHLPFKDGSVDALIAISLIEHLTLEGGRFFLKEAKRVIKNKGIIFLVTPNRRSLKSIIFGTKNMKQADLSHRYFYSPQSLTSELKKQSFRNIQCRFSFPKNCLLLGWSIPKIIQRTDINCVKDLVNWILVSSPLGLARDSFWIAAQKPAS